MIQSETKIIIECKKKKKKKTFKTIEVDEKEFCTFGQLTYSNVAYQQPFFPLHYRHFNKLGLPVHGSLKTAEPITYIPNIVCACATHTHTHTPFY